MYNICFSFIYGKTSKCRSNLLCINGGGELSRFFCTLGKIRESFQLAHQSDTIFLFSGFTKIFNMIHNQGKIFTIEQKTCSLSCLSFRISSFSSTFRIRISAFNYKFSKFFLSICKKFFFWHSLIIVFLPYFFNSKRKKMPACHHKSYMKCSKCNQSVTNTPSVSKGYRVFSTFLHFLHLFLKNFFKQKIMTETLYMFGRKSKAW